MTIASRVTKASVTAAPRTTQAGTTTLRTWSVFSGMTMIV